ncbi:MAG: hypothetical protein JW782_00210 [Candidatus Saganbacteria bacterium]|nr:hypothetical protein [Candidatus Saganbacteria bacterium]
MKNIILYSCLLALCLPLAFSGCSHFHEPTPTTTTLPPRDFLGVSLGDTSAEVLSVLGQPDYAEQYFDFLEYIYESRMRAVLFELPSTGVVTVVSANSGDDLNGIKVGQTEAHIRALLGAPDQVKTGSITYMWCYTSYKILVSFNIDDKTVVGMALYWPGKGDIDPD